MIHVALGLGGNVGDVAATFRGALAALAALPGVEVLAVSGLWQTPPWGPIAQPDYLNAAALVGTTLTPQALLAAALHIERQFGRDRAREVRFGPRNCDIDLLAAWALDGRDVTLVDPDLTLPHPRLLERAFALVPLAEVAGGLSIAGQPIAALAENCERGTITRVNAPNLFPRGPAAS